MLAGLAFRGGGACLADVLFSAGSMMFQWS